jgi:quinol monooxygenase YgiN
MIRSLILKHRERQARKRLDEIVRATRESEACRSYRKRRAAALKGLGRVQA